MTQNVHSTESARILKIESELALGLDGLSGLGRAVTFFGGARIQKESPYYAQALLLATNLSSHGYSIITGGGPGIMEAANKGAKEGCRGMSVGLNIVLPHEQRPNEHQDISLTFNYFFIRKLMFVKYAHAFVIFPGGFGTLDELFEALTLIQTKKIARFPIVLFGRSYWAGLLDWMRSSLLAHKAIETSDIELMSLADSSEEVCHILAQFAGFESLGCPAEE